MKSATILSLLMLFALPGIADAAEAIAKLDGIQPGEKAFEKSSATAPLVLKSAEEATEQLGEEVAAALAEKVDFDKQVVLVFAWRGSGQDKLQGIVRPTAPPSVTFSYTPGRTRDLRPHVHVYALDSNVRWNVR